MNAEKFIDFLKALLDSVPGKIFLIVDGHPVHKAKRVSEFVKEKADGRLSIFFLPPYSPELNPDEWVWNNVKNDRISRGVIIERERPEGEGHRRASPSPETPRHRTRIPPGSKARLHTGITQTNGTRSLQTQFFVSNFVDGA